MKSLSNYIYYKKKAISPSLCQRFLDEFAGTEEGWELNTTWDKLEDYRVSYGMCTSDPVVIGKNPPKRQPLDKEMYETISGELLKYSTQFSIPPIFSKDEGFQLLKYTPGGHYKEHSDAGTGTPRVLSVIVGMSPKGSYEGGELVFSFGKTLKLYAGDIVIFPSAFMFAHQVQPVTEGMRYSLVTWLNP